MSDDLHALLLVDKEGVIRHWDQGATRLFGYPAAETIGRSMEFLIVPSYRERHWAGFNAAIERGAPTIENPVANIPIRCASGEVRHFPVRQVFLRDPFGGAAGVLAIFAPPADDGGGLFTLYPDALTDSDRG